jgi:hypothetical protein
MSSRFIGGKDTTPEIEALRAAFNPRPGTSATHVDVANAAGLLPGSNRFVTVTQRWRKIIERETSTRVVSRDNVFHFLTADQALDVTRADLHRIGRATGRMSVRIGAINAAELSGERKELHLLLSREAAALLDSARRSAKAIQGPKPLKPANLRLAN